MVPRDRWFICWVMGPIMLAGCMDMVWSMAGVITAPWWRDSRSGLFSATEAGDGWSLEADENFGLVAANELRRPRSPQREDKEEKHRK